MQVYNEHVHMYTEMLVDWEAWGLAGSTKNTKQSKTVKTKVGSKGDANKGQNQSLFLHCWEQHEAYMGSRWASIGQDGVEMGYQKGCLQKPKSKYTCTLILLLFWASFWDQHEDSLGLHGD